MAYDINALMGQNLTPQEKIMADQLRGQQRQGQVLGMSTLAPVAQMGQAQAVGASQAAKQAGGLKLTRDQMAADAERRAADKAESLRRYTADRAATAEYRGEQRAERGERKERGYDETFKAKARVEVSKLSDKFDKSNLPEMEVATDAVDEELARAYEKTGGGDIASLGGIANTQTLGKVYTLAATDHRLRVAINNMLNARIKAQAGSAVSINEMDRQRAAAGYDWSSSEEDFVYGIELYRKMQEAEKANIMQGASTAARHIWEQRTGGDTYYSPDDYVAEFTRSGAPSEETPADVEAAPDNPYEGMSLEQLKEAKRKRDEANFVGPPAPALPQAATRGGWGGGNRGKGFGG